MESMTEQKSSKLRDTDSLFSTTAGEPKPLKKLHSFVQKSIMFSLGLEPGT